MALRIQSSAGRIWLSKNASRYVEMNATSAKDTSITEFNTLNQVPSMKLLSNHLRP